MADVNFTTNPNGDQMPEDIQAKFQEFNNRLFDLANQYGYADFLLTIYNPARKVFHTAVNTNDITQAARMLFESERTVRDFVRLKSARIRQN